MDLSNLDSKFTECLGPSTIAAALVDNSCVRQLWLQNRFRPNTKDSKILEKWKLQHSSCLINLTSYLSKKHPEAKVDSEVQLPKIKFLGVTLFGAVDCLLQLPNGEIGIFDAKTGARKSFHWFQIGIYYLMQKAIARNQGLPIPKLYSLGLFYDEKLVVLYTYESDLGDGWEDPEVHDNPEDIRQSALQMGTNIVFYGLIR